MDKIIIPDVETAIGTIAEKPFTTQRRNVQLDEIGLLFESKKFEWTSLNDVKVKFFLGNPYIQMNFENDQKISLWFPTKWYKLRRNPWFASSEQLTMDFIEKVSSFQSDPSLKTKIQSQISESQNSLTLVGRIYQTSTNAVFLLLPLITLYLLISFILWVMDNPGGVFEL
ncbi:MAG: hypothetical protein HeimC3_00540 [Candidatus Heimdallarchaeota archaeon LC_3]|nr:MAG: hypothetical protein HeimC3_00540 [Candidatus Heimdallarchaeota archaeon LC_3]